MTALPSFLSSEGGSCLSSSTDGFGLSGAFWARWFCLAKVSLARALRDEDIDLALAVLVLESDRSMSEDANNASLGAVDVYCPASDAKLDPTAKRACS